MDHRTVLMAGLIGLASLAYADDSREPLPDPLDLDQALRLAVADVPTLLSANAGREEANADFLAAQSLHAMRIDLEGRARLVQPSFKSNDDDRNDSQARLLVRKRLYDFGYGDALESAADKSRQASELEAREARQQSVLTIMRAFFDVVLADQSYARDNEAMSVAFLAWDKARDENELGRFSDVELLRLEADYEEARRQRLSTEQSQRLSRSRLAIAMGRPNDLVSNLSPPAIEPEQPAEGDFEEFWRRVQAGQPRLRALAMRLEAANDQLASARASDAPVLSAELEAAVYNRNTASTHPLGGGLLLEVPLYTGSRKDAALMQAQAGVTAAKAAFLEAQLQLRQQALEAWLERTRLRSDIRAFGIQGDYRDLYLDRSRALYELEVKTDLGDAMTRISEVRVKRMRALFDWAVNEARIKALTGSLLEDKT